MAYCCLSALALDKTKLTYICDARQVNNSQENRHTARKTTHCCCRLENGSISQRRHVLYRYACCISSNCEIHECKQRLLALRRKKINRTPPSQALRLGAHTHAQAAQNPTTCREQQSTKKENIAAKPTDTKHTKHTCLPIFQAWSAITVMNTSVAFVTSSSPSLEMFPTAGSRRTALRTLARGSTRLVGPPGADAAELHFAQKFRRELLNFFQFSCKILRMITGF